MNFKLNHTSIEGTARIELPKSKSIANRLLIAQALAKNSFVINGLSNAEDTRLLKRALQSNDGTVNIGMAGTAMRFLTAYFSIKEGNEVIVTGEQRMKERPIGILVEKLRELDADIEYAEYGGFPPLRIKGKKLMGGYQSIDASISSQFISAILLIAPYLKGGLQLRLKGNIVSFPYIDMTLNLMNKLGIEARRDNVTAMVKEGEYRSEEPIEVESDWSAAAFFYQLVSFSKQEIILTGLKKQSIQGDSTLPRIFNRLGVSTRFVEEGVVLLPKEIKQTEYQEFDLLKTPDLAQSVAVTASQMIDKTIIKGISTLRIKETDRVQALKTELLKVGSRVEEVGEAAILIYRSKPVTGSIEIDTYKDHRMAMSFASLGAKYPSLQINNVNVVDKSFPNFWQELKKTGFQLKAL